MPQMLQVLRERAIGMLTAGMSTRAVAQEFLPLLSSSAGEIHVQSDLNLETDLGNLRLSISLPL